ncbi:hypothetical protein PV797_13975 [Clostridiaceae bacterium M8S5]|nr:hypothetical protein PV797_13975 [Clostridiaceae bacterium M8S5]
MVQFLISVAYISKYIYMRTDVFSEFIIVMGSISLIAAIIFLYSKYIVDKKYNWVGMIIITFTTYGLYIIAKRYLLVDRDLLIVGVQGAVISQIFKSKVNKYKVIMYGIISIIVVFIVIDTYNYELSRLSKPRRYAIEAVKEVGYESKDIETIGIFFDDGIRNKEIKLDIFIKKDKAKERIWLEAKYQNDKITNIIKKRKIKLK